MWTGVNEQRRLALEANGGDLVSTKIFPATVHRVPPARRHPLHARRSRGSRCPARPAENYGGLVPRPVVPHRQHHRRSCRCSSSCRCGGASPPSGHAGCPAPLGMRIPLLGMLAIPGAILFYGYIAYRYTSEVVPALALAGAVGYVDLARRLEGRPPLWRRVAFVAAGVLAVFGFAANLAVGFYTSRINNPDELRAYLRLQEELSDRTPGEPVRRPAPRQSPTLPRRGRRPTRSRSSATARRVYVGTGEPLWPWMPVELRELGWDLDLRDLPGTTPAPSTSPSPRRPTTPATASCCTSRTAPSAARSTRARRSSAAGPARSPRTGSSASGWWSDLELMQYVLVDIDNPARGPRRHRELAPRRRTGSASSSSSTPTSTSRPPSMASG